MHEGGWNSSRGGSSDGRYNNSGCSRRSCCCWSGDTEIKQWGLVHYFHLRLVFLWGRSRSNTMAYDLTKQEASARANVVLLSMNNIGQLREAKPLWWWCYSMMHIMLLLHWEEESLNWWWWWRKHNGLINSGLKIGLVHRSSGRIRHHIGESNGEHLGGRYYKLFWGRFLRRWRWWGWGCSSSGLRERSGSMMILINKVVMVVQVLWWWVLEMAKLVLAPGLAVLEPIEDIGITHLPILLQLCPYLPYLIPRRIHHSRVEYSLQYSDLLRFRVPPWLWLWTSLFTTTTSYKV